MITVDRGSLAPQEGIKIGRRNWPADCLRSPLATADGRDVLAAQPAGSERLIGQLAAAARLSEIAALQTGSRRLANQSSCAVISSSRTVGGSGRGRASSG